MDDLLFDIEPMTPSEEDMERWFEAQAIVDIYEAVDIYMYIDR